ncbi:toxin-antitoxin system, antitoxin component, ribbon-helix-helix domain protein [delta proteobacterium NaphS2]|nr:toxin-antitoxin system, antitoxin component, ribbon-helix-helix domain protein [delta proteobacterium NaphS2]
MVVYTLCRGLNMIRTQIYLTEHQRNELAIMAKSLGKKQSELIREAIDRLIDQAGKTHRKQVLQKAAGIWSNRTDLPDFETIRSEWNRGL